MPSHIPWRPSHCARIVTTPAKRREMGETGPPAGMSG
jgi:hypothetical protein